MFRKHGGNVPLKQCPPSSPIAEHSTSSSLPTLSLSQETSETLSDSADRDHQLSSKRKRKS